MSVSQVGDELLAGDDELSEWTKHRGEEFFRETDPATLPAFGAVSAWVSGQSFEPAAVNTFLQVADYYLVAYAKAHGHTIVTHEVPSDSRRKIKIPTVCIGIGVLFISPYAMLVESAPALFSDQVTETQCDIFPHRERTGSGV